MITYTILSWWIWTKLFHYKLLCHEKVKSSHNKSAMIVGFVLKIFIHFNFENTSQLAPITTLPTPLSSSSSHLRPSFSSFHPPPLYLSLPSSRQTPPPDRSSPFSPDSPPPPLVVWRPAKGATLPSPLPLHSPLTGGEEWQWGKVWRKSWWTKDVMRRRSSCVVASHSEVLSPLSLLSPSLCCPSPRHISLVALKHLTLTPQPCWPPLLRNPSTTPRTEQIYEEPQEFGEEEQWPTRKRRGRRVVGEELPMWSRCYGGAVGVPNHWSNLPRPTHMRQHHVANLVITIVAACHL